MIVTMNIAHKYLRLFAFLTVFTVLAAMATEANADPLDTEKRIRQCSEITARVDRLICYDELSKEMGYAAVDKVEREEEILETYGFWKVAKKRNAAGEEIIYLKNDSIEHVTTKSGMTRQPTLVVKCKNGSTDVYIDWKASLVPRAYSTFKTQNLVYQMGSERTVPAQWEMSTDRHAIFAPNPIDFVKQMRKHDKLIFQVSPRHDAVQTIVHDISGLNTVLKILVDECYEDESEKP